MITYPPPNPPFPIRKGGKELSIVIPVYNSQDSLAELLERLGKVLPRLAQEYEAVLVNDGSRDRSWQVILELCERYPWVRAVNLMRNYGQHNALLCGVRQACGEIIVTMDDDLQHPPEEIHKLLARLEEGFDVVYGVPEKQPHAWWRNLFSVIIRRLLMSITGVRNVRDFAAFRAFRKRLCAAFENYQNPNVILDVLLSWGTARFANVTVIEKPRSSGHSNYNLWRLVQYTMVVLTGFSTLPLRFTSMLGFLFTLVGIAVFLYVLGVYFLLGSIPGFPFLASIISMFSGMQLFALGIIGEYLARIFDRSMDRPPYVIGERNDGNQAPPQPRENPASE
jgi:undecaprenyl-phosphate 4-deoxy-4-formamido-L-arabinose transferase